MATMLEKSSRATAVVLGPGLGTEVESLELVRAFVGHATVPVLLEFRFRELRRSNRLSLRDAVSGLPNREYFDLSMERAFAAAQRGHPLLLVQFNIDNLGVVNARFGRPSGTAVVQTFAKLLARQTRREDLSVRFDDTRFVALLADTDVAGANMFASRVLEQFRRSPFPWGRQTASAGVAAFDAMMASPDFLLETLLIRILDQSGVVEDLETDELVDVTGTQGRLIELHPELLHPDGGDVDHRDADCSDRTSTNSTGSYPYL